MTTPAEHDEILADLAAREPIFHRRAFGTSRDALENMTAPDFWEIGASGRIYNREIVIETLMERYKTPEPHDWPCRDFVLRDLAEGLYQLSYVLEEPGRLTRRTTLWRRVAESWQIVFHQGTIIAP